MQTDRDEDEKSRQRIIATFESRHRPRDEENPGALAILAAAERIEVPDPADPADMEAKLARQINELDVIFAECGKRAARDLGGYHDSFDLYLRFALKSQAQFRQTAGQLSALRKSRLAQQAKEASSVHPQKLDDPTNGIRQNA
jgi:hypothetical protein